MHIYARNNAAAERNRFMLEQCPGQLHTFDSSDTIKEQNTRLFDIVMPAEFHKTGRLVKQLQLKIGARVMLTNNIDISDGLTNGAVGTVTHIISCADTVILVEFDNKKVGRHAKGSSRYKHIAQNSVPVKRYQATFNIDGRKSAHASRTQYPLVLSWAVTIHKVQGLTLDAVVVDMSLDKGSYNPGQAYVAFSRVKTLQGLHIVNYNIEQLKVDNRIHQFTEQNRQNQIAPTPCSIIEPMLHDMSIVHQNVQGINVHRHDIDNHHVLALADIICMTETHLQTQSKWPLKGISESGYVIYRQERSTSRGGGLAICIAKYLHAPMPIHNNISSLELLHVKLYMPRALHIICTYKSPRQDTGIYIQALLDYVKSVPVDAMCVIVGDFNIDLDKTENSLITTTMKAENFTQHITIPTTDHGTLLDHIYTRNINQCQTAVYDTYYSYHDLVALTMKFRD